MTNYLKKLFEKYTKSKETFGKTIIENKTIIRDLTQYRIELGKGNTNFDYSQLDVHGEDIQYLNLENLNLDINLRDIFVPGNGSSKFGNNILQPVFSAYYGDYFLKIQNSKLGGNKVIGDLTPFYENSNCKPVYFWYSEETFDDNYKSKYPQYFLSKDAPVTLREKYYNPKIVYQDVVDPGAVINDLEEKNKKIKSIVRQTLTFEEYLKYYIFLKGKYLGNFSISKQDLLQIELVENYGLEQRKEILEHINNIVNNANQNGNCDNYAINEINNEGISLTLELKYKRK